MMDRGTPQRLRAGLLHLVLAAALAGCSTAPIEDNREPPAAFDYSQLVPEDITTAGDGIKDPWEGLNRNIYRFNYRVDTYVVLPLTKFYFAITPRFVRTGVNNFFTNFSNINTILNSALQFSGRKTFQTTGRLAVNSTIGLLGLFDPATSMGIPQHKEDFGQTLGVWGVGPGPYVVLPLLGPSSVRDGIGHGVDFFVETWVRDQIVELGDLQKLGWTLLRVVDTRGNVAFLYYETGSPFEYELVRLLWSTKRQLDVEK